MNTAENRNETCSDCGLGPDHASHDRNNSEGHFFNRGDRVLDIALPPSCYLCGKSKPEHRGGRAKDAEGRSHKFQVSAEDVKKTRKKRAKLAPVPDEPEESSDEAIATEVDKLQPLRELIDAAQATYTEAYTRLTVLQEAWTAVTGEEWE